MKNEETTTSKIRVAIAGVGNCAASLIEGLEFYRQNPDNDDGLLFPNLAGYNVRDINIALAIDISSSKVGKSLSEAIYEYPNNFVRQRIIGFSSNVTVVRGPTLDGNPPHLAHYVHESESQPVDISGILADSNIDVLVNLLPTGSIEATEYYAKAALDAGCGFINCIPTVLAQRKEFQDLFQQKGLPILGDDIKSQVGTTILHRAVLHMLESRGAKLKKTSQVNIGGNTDFANFVHRAETKLVSKRKSLQRYVDGAEFHVGHHYDVTRGPLKTAFIDIEALVFGNSSVKLSIKLESDDKPNSAGSVCDLIRICRGSIDRKLSGFIPEACAYYMKSPPLPMDDHIAYEQINQFWLSDEVKKHQEVDR